MNNLLSAVIAIAATGLLLLLREFVLSVGKRKINSTRRPVGEPGFHGSDVEIKGRLQALPTRQSVEPTTDAASVGVDEFLTELRAKAQEQSPSSKTRDGSTTERGSDQSNREHLAGAWR